MTTTFVTADIEEFAAQVRSHLADLGAEEIEELTGGLEADLAEELQERPAGSTLRDPAGYALELRTAAGLPLKQSKKARPFADFVTSLRQQRDDMAVSLRTNRFLSSVMDFATSLRPSWWILRAWVAYQVVVAFWLGVGGVLPESLGGWLFLLTSFTTSVQWGRGQWLRGNWMGGLVSVGNVAAVLLLVPALSVAGTFANQASAGDFYDEGETAVTGLSSGGEPVGNVFAYDAQGNLLENVQLFDQSGKPLAIDSNSFDYGCLDKECLESAILVPGQLETGATTWNIFPLQQVPTGDAVYNERTDRNEPAEGVDATQPVVPFIKVPAVFGADKSELAPDKAKAKSE